MSPFKARIVQSIIETTTTFEKTETFVFALRQRLKNEGQLVFNRLYVHFF